MNIITLNTNRSERDTVLTFGGLCRQLSAGAGELSYDENMTDRYYPFLASGGDSVLVREDLGRCYGLLAKDAIARVSGVGEGESVACRLYFGEKDTGLVLTPGEKQLVSMGTKIIIFPDNMYYDTYSGESGSLESYFTTEEGVNVRYTLTRLDASDYDYDTSPTAPESPSDGALWCDTSSSPAVLKVYSESSGSWVGVESVYVKISYPGIGRSFSEGDGVEISGSILEDLNNVSVIMAKDEDFIIVVGMVDGEKIQSTPLTISRRVPVMDFVTECDNRLWGCRWGLDNSGNFVNEIYASKLGDPFNWQCYEGISTDSYRASLGSDGPFTGAVTYLGYILFFKENMLHKVFGTKPANFQITGLAVRGVMEGCHRSLCIIDEILYYAGVEGILAYDGSLPYSVSEKLGESVLRDVICGSGAYSLYVSACDETGERQLYVYNTRHGIWHRYSPRDIEAICNYKGNVYYAARGGLYVIDLADSEREEIFTLFDGARDVTAESWCFETGEMAPRDGYHSYVTKVQLRVKVERGATFRVEVKCSENVPYKTVGVVTPTADRLFTIPVITGRSHSLKLRLSGKGRVIIYSVGRSIERVSEHTGGDI